MNNYKALYEAKRMTVEDIVSNVDSNMVICSDIGVSTPVGINKVLKEHVKRNNLSNITYHTILEWFPMGAYEEEFHGQLRGVSWYTGAVARKGVNEGFGDIMPAYYRDMPSLFNEYIDIDVLFVCVSPMDENGCFSTGVAGSNIEVLLNKAKRVYLEVNEYMPRALGGPTIHISKVDGICEHHVELPVAPTPTLDEVSLQIGNYIAEEIPNGATIQLGIGSIPDAVGAALMDKRDLGIHSEMFTESMVDLINAGAVTNEKKPIHKGFSVTTFAFGSKIVYDFIDNNPKLQLLPVDYVNDPAIISKHPNFMSVNSALEVDFFGQVCAESIGTYHVSGTGGQVDYVRGAVESKGGKSFIAFPSTAKGGTISRIKATLTPGAIVTTTKNDVDHIVTEYGIAKLRGKSVSERTKALINIAHPKFREELTFEAKKANILV